MRSSAKLMYIIFLLRLKCMIMYVWFVARPIGVPCFLLETLQYVPTVSKYVATAVGMNIMKTPSRCSKKYTKMIESYRPTKNNHKLPNSKRCMNKKIPPKHNQPNYSKYHWRSISPNTSDLLVQKQTFQLLLCSKLLGPRKLKVQTFLAKGV